MFLISKNKKKKKKKKRGAYSPTYIFLKSLSAELLFWLYKSKIHVPTRHK